MSKSNQHPRSRRTEHNLNKRPPTAAAPGTRGQPQQGQQMKIFAEVHITFHTPIFTVRQNDGDESIGSVSASKVDSVSFSQVCYQVRGLNETSAVIEIYKTTGARAIFIFDMSNVSTFMAIPSLVTQSSAVN